MKQVKRKQTKQAYRRDVKLSIVCVVMVLYCISERYGQHKAHTIIYHLFDFHVQEYVFT